MDFAVLVDSCQCMKHWLLIVIASLRYKFYKNNLIEIHEQFSAIYIEKSFNYFLSISRNNLYVHVVCEFCTSVLIWQPLDCCLVCSITRQTSQTTCCIIMVINQLVDAYNKENPLSLVVNCIILQTFSLITIKDTVTVFVV